MIHIEQKIATYFSDKKRLCILWFGKEWKSTLKFLEHFWITKTAEVVVHDQTIQGDEHLTWLDTYDIIIKSAWITWNLEELQPVFEKITTQTKLFFQFFPWNTIAVTGTKGKSTTTSLIHHLLKTASIKSELIGNIWKAQLDVFLEKELPEWAVIELSSYQLDNITVNPTIGIVLSLYHEHHIPRHGSSQAYYQSKLSLLDNAEHCLISAQAQSYANEQSLTIPSAELFWETGKYSYTDWLFFVEADVVSHDSTMMLQWVHNKYNACAALGVNDILWISTEHFQETLDTYWGLEHRLEKVGTYGWIQWINDAISTTPQSTIAALHTFWDQVNTLFLWGKDGGYDFSPLIACIQQSKVQNIVLFPDNGDTIKQLLDEKIYTLYETDSMEDAVKRTAKKSLQWSIALLSCASPSYSLWSWFEEKWTLFKKAIKTLA